MSFGSFEHLLQRVSSGFYTRTDFAAIPPTTFAVARWYDFSSRMFSDRNSFAGTSLTWRSCNESTGNGTEVFGMYHGGNVSTATKHILNASVVGASSSALGNLLLVDLQGYWPGISTNSSSLQTLSGTPSLRYTNGEGCQLYFVQTVASGATAHNLSLSYTNQAGTSSRSLRSTVSMTPSAIVTHISHSGTSAGNFGPFLPLAAGDYGVQNVASVTFSAASGAGTGALCLARPLLSVPLSTAFTMTERDLISNLPSLPRVYDGACLVWLIFPYAIIGVNSPFYGYLDFGWA
jgi:hypothetical protein